MFTELWPGWFQTWGQAVPHRPAVDVAFAVARWYGKGGTYLNYYMAYGGSTFGRHVGGPLIITSYDYDVQISEYGLRAEPKFSLTRQMHEVLYQVAPVMLASNDLPSINQVSQNCEVHTYNVPSDTIDSELAAIGCVSFLSNIGDRNSCTFTVGSKSFVVPAWSVSILSDSCSTSPKQLFNTKSNAADIKPNAIVTSSFEDVSFAPFEVYVETIPASLAETVVANHPLDHLEMTQDATDYLWISSVVNREVAGEVSLKYDYGESGGPVLYAYVNGQLADATISLTPRGLATEHVLNTAKSSSSRMQQQRTLDEGIPSSLTVSLPAGESTIDLLFMTMGLQNYGPYLEKIRPGVVSDIYIDGEPLTSYTHRAGLDGESLRLYDTSSSPHVEQYQPDDGSSKPLTWYRSTFPTPKLYDAEVAISVDISNSKLGKGAVYVNGFMLGRYWNIMAPSNTCEVCTSESYTGGYNADKCRTGCDEMSQSLYKIPYGLLSDVDR
jgi:hypothetical protein